MSPSVPTQGFFLTYSTRGEESVSGGAFGHRFCGEHGVTGADCPNCRTPLLHLLTLDCRDPRLGLEMDGGSLLRLFYCWRCNVVERPLIYRIESDDHITVLDHAAGNDQGEDFPYEDYPRHFPAADVTLTPLTTEQQEVIRSLNEGTAGWEDVPEALRHLAEPHHQIGGEPYLVQGSPDGDLPCRGCGRPMPLLAAVADDCLDARGFVGDPFVQVLFHFCRACGIVAAYNRCD